ncbi:unnamed protein product [Mucor hiemalis]
MQRLSKTSAEPTYVEELASNGIMWLDDRYRRAYNCKEDTWKVAMEDVGKAYKEGETYNDYKDLDNISEMIRRSLPKAEDEIFKLRERLTLLYNMQVFFCTQKIPSLTENRIPQHANFEEQ